jgi:prepilin-type N-terminal cleavage/methylation domain-containing protein
VYKTTKNRKKYDNRGFTLLEVMVAMLVLLVGVLSSAGLYFIVARNNTTGNVATQAVLLAQSRIDQIKNTPDVTNLNGIIFASEANIIPLRGDQQPMDGGGVFNIDYRFCDPMNAILAGAGYTPPNAFQGDMCRAAVTPVNFADCGTAPSCQAGSSSTCLAAVRVSWNRVAKGRSGSGCVVLQTLTQGRGI